MKDKHDKDEENCEKCSVCESCQNSLTSKHSLEQNMDKKSRNGKQSVAYADEELSEEFIKYHSFTKIESSETDEESNEDVPPKRFLMADSVDMASKKFATETSDTKRFANLASQQPDSARSSSESESTSDSERIQSKLKDESSSQKFSRSEIAEIPDLTLSKYIFAKYRIQVVEAYDDEDVPDHFEDIFETPGEHYHPGPRALDYRPYSDEFRCDKDSAAQILHCVLYPWYCVKQMYYHTLDRLYSCVSWRLERIEERYTMERICCDCCIIRYS